MIGCKKWLTVLNWSLTIAILTYVVLIIDIFLAIHYRVYSEISQTSILRTLIWIDRCVAYTGSIIAFVISISLRLDVVPEQERRRFLRHRVVARLLIIITNFLLLGFILYSRLGSTD